MQNVEIVGSEVICSAGLNKFATYQNVSAQKSFVNSDGLAPISDLDWTRLREKTHSDFLHSKSTILSYNAFLGALKESTWNNEELQSSGFIFASTTSQIDQWEQDIPQYKNPLADRKKIEFAIEGQSLGAQLKIFAEHFQIQGFKTAVSSSCSAGLQGIALAYHLIKSGKLDRCIVGSTEILSDLTSLGFNCLRLIAKSPSKPFSKNRNGINLGEGSGFLFLEKRNPTHTSWGQIQGASFNMDAYHPTSPHPEGRGSFLTLNAATSVANLKPSDVDWIYAHGTGSPANDLAEAKAIHSFFGEAKCAPITSTKSIHGHTLAASGVIESVLGLMAMKENQILPTFNDGVFDPLINLDYFSATKPAAIRCFIKNSLGFGGINASVVFSAPRSNI